MPTTPTLVCDRCRTVLTAASVNTPEPVACPGCHAALLARVFPAFYRVEDTGGRAAEGVASDEDASCFYHPRKKAVVPCARCGRFLCALCDLDFDGRHLCPGCVAGARTSDDRRTALPEGLLVGSHTLHDKLALLLALVPLFPLFWVFTLLTAPLALFFAIRYWNEPPRSPMPRGRWRLVTAGLLALGQIGVWVYIFCFQLANISAALQ